MGEQADMCVNGECCSWCSSLFEKAHGYPVVCNRCYDSWEVPPPLTKEGSLKTLALQLPIYKLKKGGDIDAGTKT